MLDVYGGSIIMGLADVYPSLLLNENDFNHTSMFDVLFSCLCFHFVV